MTQNIFALLFYTFTALGSQGATIDTVPQPRFGSTTEAYYRGMWDLCVISTDGDYQRCYQAVTVAYTHKAHLNESLDYYWSFDAVEELANKGSQ